MFYGNPEGTYIHKSILQRHHGSPTWPNGEARCSCGQRKTIFCK